METKKSRSNDLPKQPAEPVNEIERVKTDEEYNENLKQRLENDFDGKIIDWGQLIEIEPDFAHWLHTIVKGDGKNVDSHILIYYNDSSKRIRCFLYTNNNRYTINAVIPTEDKSKGYLSAGFSRRKPNAGENWTRGGDLSDGSFNKETFDAIIRKIIATELKKLELWR